MTGKLSTPLRVLFSKIFSSHPSLAPAHRARIEFSEDVNACHLEDKRLKHYQTYWFQPPITFNKRLKPTFAYTFQPPM